MAWVEKSGKHTWRVRYETDDGIASIPGFPTKKAADDAAADIEAQQRSETWIDPAAGRTTLGTYVDQDWLDALDVGERTEENYRSKLKNHILPRWQDTPLTHITNSKARAWAKTLRHNGLAPVTASDTMKLLSLILSDAADDQLIPTNPIRSRHRGKASRTRTREKVWATPHEVLQIADQAAAYYGHDAAILILTAAWTGARWGELTGLQRPNLHLDDATLVIDPDIGALHESNSGKLWLGPPKTPESARTITLPDFLIPLLKLYLDTHDHDHVFVTTDVELQRRSNFSRRAMRPAADGNLDVTRPRVRTQPIKPGLVFHGLRHSHKTWLIADGIPDIAQSRRLGHKLPDKIQETYSHVAAEVEQRLIAALTTRWDEALNALRPNEVDTTWRTAA
ncbi:tyrosine-type recombinase/integrase [Kibdelosporangium phytohabitans]|uniref:Multidrug DMT transporter permease n=1 Tax=Kibdelosporangium phytohabitans TaxID=860235 RepID=A0A0N9HXV2_9PSEU|nr:site-specific integrase [Kibdelosporangium phytohabitans]ALG06930.1 multidrug DMT transporter permease [Kibdelosporangium phytohabitans]MBE1468193.1 integrase [Kibdelosporangium phytohabitans]